MAKKKPTQMKIQFDKRGQNSVKASKIYQQSKKEWTKIFNQEVKKEKDKKTPNMPLAAQRASKRYGKVRMDWSEAQRKAGKQTKKK